MLDVSFRARNRLTQRPQFSLELKLDLNPAELLAYLILYLCVDYDQQSFRMKVNSSVNLFMFSLPWRFTGNHSIMCAFALAHVSRHAV